MAVKDANLSELLQVMALRNKGYIIFDNEEEVVKTLQKTTIKTLSQVVDELADAWELESLTVPGLTFEHALAGLRQAAKEWASSE